MSLDKNYSRNCVLRTENLIVKQAFYNNSLQRYEFYFYEGNSPIPKQTDTQINETEQKTQK